MPSRRRIFSLVTGSLLAVVVFTAQAVAVVPAGAVGYDVSWPQCGRALPPDGDAAVLGVNGGRPYTDNPCLAGQYQWAISNRRQIAFYLNTANPGAASQSVNWYAQRTPDAGCSPANEAACAYDYGFVGAQRAFAYARSQTGVASRYGWWLDVETGNSWSGDRGLNNASIVGAVSYLRSQGVPAGVYSTSYQWGLITGGARLDLPSWVAGAGNGAQAASWCVPERTITGGPVLMVQWVEDNLDHNHLCGPLPAALAPAKVAPQANAAAALRALLRLDVRGTLSNLGAPPP